MELQDYLRILRRRWVSFVVVAVLCVAGAGLVTALTTPAYTATTQSFVSVRGSVNSTDLLQGSNFSQQQVTSYVQLVTSPLVLDPVIDELDLDTDAAELARQVSADTPPNTALINISVTRTSAQQAADVANTIATVFARVVPTFEQPTDSGESPVKITTVQPARAPTKPSAPRPQVNLALGLLVGLALGGGATVLREALDTRIRRQRDLEDVTDSPLLGVISFDSRIREHPIAPVSSQRGETVRRLRTNLQFTDLRSRPRTIVVTSAVSGEGKTTIALNLGMALAEAGARVIVVDADLRRPAASAYLGLEGSVGLTTVLLGRASLEEVTQRYGESGLDVLAAGQIPPNPSEVLGSDSMADLLEKLAATYDVVLLDTPPVLPVTDAAVLAPLCSGTLVVVGAGRVRRPQLAEALAALATVDARVLGLVLNRAPRPKDRASNPYYAPSRSD